MTQPQQPFGEGPLTAMLRSHALADADLLAETHAAVLAEVGTASPVIRIGDLALTTIIKTNCQRLSLEMGSLGLGRVDSLAKRVA